MGTSTYLLVGRMSVTVNSMTLVEIVLALVAAYLLYRGLRPLQRKIEGALYALFGSRKRTKGRIIDITNSSKYKKDKPPSDKT